MNTTDQPLEDDNSDLENALGHKVFLRPHSEEFEALMFKLNALDMQMRAVKKAWAAMQERVLDVETENEILKDAIAELRESGSQATPPTAQVPAGAAIDWALVCNALANTTVGYDTLLPVDPEHLAAVKKNLARNLAKYQVEGKFKIIERDGQVFARCTT